ncbi:MAG: hypothetical protein WDN24_06070 [Sphingomonas sp.]
MGAHPRRAGRNGAGARRSRSLRRYRWRRESAIPGAWDRESQSCRIAGSAAAVALVALAGCQPGAPPAANDSSAAAATEPAPRPAAASTFAPGSLSAWLVGSWSYGEDCATDFAVHYNADGSLNNYEDEGSWSAEGDTVTETITQRATMGEDAVEKLNPPEKRRYSVTRTDAKHGVLLFQGKQIPILRC